MGGDVNDAIIGYVAAAQVVFTGVQVDPEIGLTAAGFCDLSDLVGLDSSANEPRQFQSAGGCWFTGHVVNCALESKSQAARLRGWLHSGFAFHTRIVGTENR